jgi:hypothetical protein
MGTRLAFRLDSRRYHAGVFQATVALTRAKNVALRPSLKTLTDLLHEFIACFIREPISAINTSNGSWAASSSAGGGPLRFNGIA